jgi:dolichol-phosphate mannosyltransferase
MSKKISLVVPMFCETDNIANITDSVQSIFSNLTLEHEFIFIDDGSTDTTWQKIITLKKSIPNLKALRFSRNFGKESAIAAGLEYVDGDAAIVMDADMQHPPQLIPEMIRAWEKGYLVVEATKQVRQQENLLNRLLSNLYYLMFRILTGIDIRNASDFKLLDRVVIEEWKKIKERQLFFRGCVSWLGFESHHISYVPAKRHSGDSKWSFMKLFQLAITSITSFSAKPLFLIWIFATIFFILSIALTVKIIYLLIQNETVPGFFTIYFLQLISGSLILFSLGLIATYLQQIYSETKNRPRYIISEKI